MTLMPHRVPTKEKKQTNAPIYLCRFPGLCGQQLHIVPVLEEGFAGVILSTKTQFGPGVIRGAIFDQATQPGIGSFLPRTWQQIALPLSYYSGVYCRSKCCWAPRKWHHHPWSTLQTMSVTHAHYSNRTAIGNSVMRSNLLYT